jgi:polar amino acid transport system substrate-binding protein
VTFLNFSLSGRRLAATIAVATVALVGTACGGSSDGDDGDDKVDAGSGVDQALADKVPDAIKSDGVISVGSDSTYPPSEFLDTDGKTIIGFDVDLFDAVAAKLGLETKWTTAGFDALIQNVASGKFEAGVSSFTINPEREQEALMVSYFNAGTQWATEAGNPSGISPDDACGHKVAVQKGTVQVDDLEARSKACEKAGKDGITIDQYAAQTDATNAAISGKDDAVLADSPVMAYAVDQTEGQLELLGDIYDAAPYGYVFSKDQAALAEAVQGALQALIDDGSYQKILDEWGVGQGAITTSETNPDVS